MFVGSVNKLGLFGYRLQNNADPLDEYDDTAPACDEYHYHKPANRTTSLRVI